MDQFFFFPFISSAGALELDSMLWRLRNWHFIILLLLLRHTCLRSFFTPSLKRQLFRKFHHTDFILDYFVWISYTHQFLFPFIFLGIIFSFFSRSHVVCLWIPGSFEVKDFDDSSDSENESTGFVDGQDLCLPALRYLRQCCDMIASMCRMPSCPVFTGAQRSVML